jgi:hypothetical protein
MEGPFEQERGGLPWSRAAVLEEKADIRPSGFRHGVILLRMASRFSKFPAAGSSTTAAENRTDAWRDLPIEWEKP